MYFCPYDAAPNITCRSLPYSIVYQQEQIKENA